MFINVELTSLTGFLQAKAAYKAALLKSADEEQKLSELLERRNFRYL